MPKLEAENWRVDTASALDLTDPAASTRLCRLPDPMPSCTWEPSHLQRTVTASATIRRIHSAHSIYWRESDRQNIALSHFVFASTAAVYGNQGLALLHERLTPNPESDYGISKLAAEHLVRLHSSAQTTVVLRPFNYTGVGQEKQFIIPKLVSHYALRKPTIELGNIDVAREFNDVRWAVSVYVAALQHTGKFVTLNLCSGQAHSLRRVMQTLEALTSHRPELKINPAFVRANDLPSLAGDPGKTQCRVQPHGSQYIA